MGTKQIVSGMRFGKWTVICKETVRRRRSKWICVCDCGTVKPVLGRDLVAGKSQSCGCSKIEATRSRSLLHGDTVGYSMTPEYRAWSSIRNRCYNPNFIDYDRYGGRGVKVAQRWLDSYPAFLEDMGRRPAGRYSIDRINNDGDYEPGNCRWATDHEQSTNKGNNVWIQFNGRRMTVSEWAKELGMNYGTLMSRKHRGLSDEDVLTLPVQSAGRRRFQPKRNNATNEENAA